MPDSVMRVYGRHHADVEAQIQQLRAALLHKEQEHELVQLQLAKEKGGARAGRAPGVSVTSLLTYSILGECLSEPSKPIIQP